MNPDACPSMDGVTSAGLVAMPTGHRRESFLYRSAAQQDMLMMTLKSTAATSREQLYEETIVTPFAQILHRLRNVRTQYVKLTEYVSEICCVLEVIFVIY